MENLKEVLSDEMSKINDKVKTTSALVQEKNLELNEHTKEINELGISVETTVKEIVEAKSKLWQLEMNRTNLVSDNRELRESCCQIGQNLDSLNVFLENYQSLCDKSKTMLTLNADDEKKLEHYLEAFEKIIEKYVETGKHKITELKNHYEAEIETRKKQLQEIEYEELKLDAELPYLQMKMADLTRIIEENEFTLRAKQTENIKLKSEIAEKENVLEEERKDIEKIKKEFEDIEKENEEILEELTSCSTDLLKIEEEDEMISSEMQTEKDEECKLKGLIDSVVAETNALKARENFANARYKQIIDRVFGLGFQLDPEAEPNLKELKQFITDEIDCLKQQKTEFEQSTKIFENKTREILQQKETLENKIQQAEIQMEKIKSDQLTAEVEYHEVNLKLKQQTEIQNQELDALKARVNTKAEALEILNSEIKQIENAYNWEQACFAEKHKELDTAIERLNNDKKSLMQQLSESTQNLKKVEHDCENLSHDIVKLENKKSQLIAPEKETAVVQACFRKQRSVADSSENSFEGISISNFFSQRSNKK